MATRGGGTSGGHQSGGKKMNVGVGIDPADFSRDAYEVDMHAVNGTIVRLSLVVAPHKAQRKKTEILIFERLEEHQMCVTVARSSPIVSPEMDKLVVMVGPVLGI